MKEKFYSQITGGKLQVSQVFLGKNMVMVCKNYINSQSSTLICRNHSPKKGQMNNNAFNAEMF